jgi:hypothetical protein
VKKWRTASEWFAFALCWGDPRFTADDHTDEDLRSVRLICADCPVRVECGEWALQKKATGVIAAGVHLPDPGRGLDPNINKDARRFAYSTLRKQLREERAICGEEI